MTIRLKGITWNHSRGFVSVAATAQRYTELHPDVEIVWQKRSLQAFADAPIEELAEQFDLLVIDHPWAGFAADKQILVPLQEHLPAAYLAEQAAGSVGRSHESYRFGEFQSALAIDAATPVASYRPDLLDARELSLPATWDDLLSLARGGAVAFPAIPIDSLMNFYMLCVTQGEEPCVTEERVVSREMGIRALEQLRELADRCPREMFGWNPIAVYEAMTAREDLVYCPFAYGYSNYSRAGYAGNRLKAADLVSVAGCGPLRSALGGTGLAISAKCGHIAAALDYAAFTASPACQRTLYTAVGGQPGHRSAWTDAEANRITDNYFRDTLPALDRAYLRPRYSGYLGFQDRAGDYVREYMMHGGSAERTLARMDGLYVESRKGVKR